MAKKEKLQTDPYNFDTDFSFDDYDESFVDGMVDPSVKKEDRTPVDKVLRGTLKGAKDKALDPSFIGGLVRKTLPSTYGEIVDTVDKVAGTTTALYDQAGRELKPQASRLAKRVDKLVPDEYKRTKKITGKISQWLGGDEGGGSQTPTKEQVQDQSVALALAQTFGEQNADSQKQQAERDTENRMQNVINRRFSQSSISLLSSIDNNISRQSRYNEKINMAWQKRTLENSYRHLFELREISTALKTFADVNRNQMEAVAKNTALPEFVKINNSERFKDLARTKFFDKVQNSFFGEGTAIDRGLKKIKSDVGGYISGIKNGLETASMGVDGLEQVKELNATFRELGMEEISGAELAGNAAGGWIANKIGDKVTGKLRKKLAGNKKLNDVLYQGANAVNNLPGAIDQLQKSDKFIDAKYAGGAKGKAAEAAEKVFGYFSDSRPDTKINNPYANSSVGGKAATFFNDKTQRALVDIMPGYLARILREIQILRTGDDKIGLTYFNQKDGKFQDKKDLAASLNKGMANDIKTSGYGFFAQHETKKFTEGQKVTDKQKDKITNFLSELSAIPNMAFTPENIQGTPAYNALDARTKKVVDKILDKKITSSDDKHKGQYELTKGIMNLRQRTPDLRGSIETMINNGYGDVLADQGLVTRDENGDYRIDEKAYLKMVREHSLVVSDETKKQDIHPLSPRRALNAVRKTGIFNWNYKKGQGDGQNHNGPMAQDVQKTMGNDAAPGGKKIDLTTMNGNNMAAIQELAERQDKVEKGGKKRSYPGFRKLADDVTKIRELLEKAPSGGFGGGSGGGGAGGHDGSYKGMIGSLLSAAGSLIGRTGNDMFGLGKKGLGKAGELAKEGYEKYKDPVKNAGASVFHYVSEATRWALDFGRKTIFGTIPEKLNQLKAFGMNSMKKVGQWFNEVKDVYIPGIRGPALRAALIRAGYYRDSVTGKIIESMDDLGNLKGDIVDRAGNVVLSIEDAAKGMYDQHGETVKSSLKKLADKAMSIGKAGFDRAREFWKSASEKGMGLFNKGKEKAGGLYDRAKNAKFSVPDMGIGFGNEKIYQVLVEIRGVLRGEKTPRHEAILAKQKKDSKAKTSATVSKATNAASGAKETAKKKLQEARAAAKKKADDLKKRTQFDKRKDQLREKILKMSGGKELPFNIEDLRNKASGLKDKASAIKDKAKSFFSNDEDEFVGPMPHVPEDEFVGPRPQEKKTLRSKAKDKLNQAKEAGGEQLDRGKRRAAILARRAERKLGRKPGSVAGKLGLFGKAFGKTKGFVGGLFGGKGDKPGDEPEEKPEGKKTLMGMAAKGAKKVMGVLKPKGSGKEGQVPPGERAFNDADGNGRRDGAWQDRFDKMKAEDDAKKAEKKDYKAPEAKYKSDKSIMDTIKGIGGIAGKLFDSAKSVIGMGMSGGKLIGKLASGAAGLLKMGAKGVGAVGSIAGRVLGGVGGVVQGAGRLAGLGRLAGVVNMARNVMTVGALATGGASSVVMGALSAGLSAVTAIVSSPVVLGAVAIAAAGYGIYKLYKYATRDNVDEYEDIRMKQYGIGTGEADKKYNHFMLVLEEYLQDGRIMYGPQGAFLNDKKVKAEELLEIFNIDKDDKEGVSKFTQWFQGRFKPFFLTNISALFGADKKVKLKDVKSMKPDLQLKYLNAIAFESGPYKFETSPFKELPRLNTNPDFALNALKNLVNKVSKGKQKELQKAKPDEAKPNAIPKLNQPDRKPPEAPEKNLKDNTVKNAKLDSSPGEDGVMKESPATAKIDLGGKSVKSGLLKIAEGGVRDGAAGMQYIKLGKGVSIDSMNPSMLRNLLGMAQEYGEKTGNAITVNSGTRTNAEQAELFRKFPGKAARPGRSMHEFGLAIDVNSGDLDQLDEMGLMRKYGFTRPVGGEPWHMEAAGIQTNIAQAKEDSNFATMAVQASLMKGGGGVGAERGTPLGKRDTAYAISLLDGANVQDVKDRIANKLDTSKQIKDPYGSDAVSSPAPQKTNVAANDASFTQKTEKSNVQQASYTTKSYKSDNSFAKSDSMPDVEPKAVSVSSSSQPMSAANDGVGGDVKDVIRKVASRQSVDPNDMMTFAATESSLDPNAKATGGSAKGLFGFTNGTWNYQLQKTKASGLSDNPSPYNPNDATIMASDYYKTNAKLISGYKKNVTMTDVYLAHFLGPTGARKFLTADPNDIAANILPTAAAANRVYFYEGNRPRTVSEFYKFVDTKLAKKAKEFGINYSGGSALESKGGAEKSRASDTPPVATGDTTTSSSNTSSSSSQSSSSTQSRSTESTRLSVQGSDQGSLPQAEPSRPRVAPRASTVMEGDRAGRGTDSNSSVKSMEGISSILDQSLTEHKETNRLLKQILENSVDLKKLADGWGKPKEEAKAAVPQRPQSQSRPERVSSPIDLSRKSA